MSTLTTVAAPSGDIVEFKLGVDTLLEKRRYLIEKILPTLVEGKDYFVIKGRRSLGKAGAEKLASMFQLVAVFEKDLVARPPNFIHQPCIISRANIQAYEKTSHRFRGEGANYQSHQK